MSDTVSSYSGVYSPAEMLQVNEIERLRSRVEQLEAAIRAHREDYGGECSTAEVMRRDHALYDVLREEVKG